MVRRHARADHYSKTELQQLVEMVARNKPAAEIARAINRSEGSVRTKTSRINKVVGYPLRPQSRNVVKAELTAPTFQALRLYADADHQTIGHFTARLLHIVVTDNLIDAIIDGDAA
jgi:DNA-binding CsgD family transcriptional regulator